MRGRFQAVMVAAVCSVLSVIVWPLGYLGGGAIGLVTLHHGPRESMVLMGWAGLAAGVLTWLWLPAP